MNRPFRHFLTLALIFTLSAFAMAETPAKVQGEAEAGAPLRQEPKIVLYSVSWCPHCREAKEYMTKNGIPFINRDVEQDQAAMTELTEKYKSGAVPVIVIGNDEKILKGFSKDSLEQALQQLREKKPH